MRIEGVNLVRILHVVAVDDKSSHGSFHLGSELQSFTISGPVAICTGGILSCRSSSGSHDLPYLY